MTRRALLPTIGVAVALVAVALVVFGHAGAGSAAQSPGPAAKRLAERDAADHLAEAPLPPHTRRFTNPPKSPELKGPPLVPVTPNLIDRGAVFLTKLSPGAAFAWFKAHPPANARQALTSLGKTNGKTTSSTVGFDWGELPTVSDRELLVTVVPHGGHGAAFRIDAQAIWVTPHPASAKVPAASRLVEIELTHEGRRKAAATVTSQGEVDEFAHLIDSAPAAQPGSVSCGSEPERFEKLILTFRASRGGTALASVEQSLPPGCDQPLELTVAGHRTTLEGGQPLVRRALKSLGVKAGHKG
jgi:hypothetical protein